MRKIISARPFISNDLIQEYPLTKLSGTALWQQVQAVTKSALSSGALKSIPTHCIEQQVTLGQNSLRLQIRVVANLARKSKATKDAASQAKKPGNFDPFLPCEPALYVGELTEHYRCLLNKFNVMDHHILMVTTEFAYQREPLNSEDFYAALICLQARRGLVFFNGGPDAGSSITHKHLQMIPLTETGNEADNSYPFEPLFKHLPLTAEGSKQSTLPFPHRVAKTCYPVAKKPDEIRRCAELNCRNYHRILSELELHNLTDGLAPAHNLLMTREHMWVVPRSQSSFNNLAINALGFAGTILVKDDQQLTQLNQIGCLELLKNVTPD
ncbi:MAG: phosphorylase [Porticoccus sp.]|nr:MAG: phosphorylase [Porticoccus sp.]